MGLGQGQQHRKMGRGFGQVAQSGTLVIPRTPMLGLDEVDPLPVPKIPAIMQQMPSVKIPLEGKRQWGS